MYRQAAEYIDKSKQWPENLGVGKPYDVDTRLQDYMKSVCLLKMGKKKEAAACEDAIIKYTFSHEKVVRPSFNQILPLMVLRKKGETAKAGELLLKMKSSAEPGNAINQWAAAFYEHDRNTCERLEKAWTKNLNFQILNEAIRLVKIQ
jgi:hypothetical protein